MWKEYETIIVLKLIQKNTKYCIEENNDKLAEDMLVSL